MDIRFQIYKVKNGYLLNITRGQVRESFVYTERERMTMLAKIDQLCGEEPPDSVGLEKEN